MKTEEEIYNEVVQYINGKNHNRPCTLSTIKKVLRSKRIIDLIFSRPDIFKLKKEFAHIPSEHLTEDILIKYVLADPNNFYDIDESLQTIPIMVAFEFIKRRYEHISSIYWGSSGEKFVYKGQISDYRDSISDICDKLNVKYNDEEILKNYLYYHGKVFNEIKDYFNKFNEILEKREKVIRKYREVNFDSDDKIYILISGRPDSGKTTFSKYLLDRISNSMCFDSDMLLMNNMLNMRLQDIVRNKAKVIIFSDLYADRFFQQDEFDSDKIINILIEADSIEKMYRNSKELQYLSFEEYKKNEIESMHYDSNKYQIKVINDYSNKIDMEVDRVIEEIANKLNINILYELTDEYIENNSQMTRQKIKHKNNNN